MAIMVTHSWQHIETLPDGSPVRALILTDGMRLVGWVIDLNDGTYDARYITNDGPVSVQIDNVHDAITCVSDQALERKRHLH
jgi:hypothetical protein